MIKFEDLTKEQQIAVRQTPPVDTEKKVCPFGTLNNMACEHCRFCVDRLGEKKVAKERPSNFNIDKKRYTCIFIVSAFAGVTE